MLDYYLAPNQGFLGKFNFEVSWDWRIDKFTLLNVQFNILGEIETTSIEPTILLIDTQCYISTK